MGKILGRVGDHTGFAVGKLIDGTLLTDSCGIAATPVAYVAACSRGSASAGPHWYGPNEHPPTAEGERAAVDEWEHLHARHLTASLAQDGVPREVTLMLGRLDVLAVDSPVAMLAELRRIQRHTDALLAIAATCARTRGASWATIAGALDMTEQVVRERFDAGGEPPP